MQVIVDVGAEGQRLLDDMVDFLHQLFVAGGNIVIPDGVVFRRGIDMVLRHQRQGEAGDGDGSFAGGGFGRGLWLHNVILNEAEYRISGTRRDFN